MYSFFLSYVHSITRAFLNTNTYDHWSPDPTVRAYHVLRYHRKTRGGVHATGQRPPNCWAAPRVPDQAGRVARRRADLRALAYRATSLTSLVSEGHVPEWTSKARTDAVSICLPAILTSLGFFSVVNYY